MKIELDEVVDQMNSFEIVFFSLVFEGPELMNYELADHCVTLKRSGHLSQVESLRTVNYKQQLSSTTEEVLKHLPRSLSEEIFDRVK